MNSRIYQGNVVHVRKVPVPHSFAFPIYFYAIDLADLPDLDRSIRGFGYNRWRPVSLHDKDYLRGSGRIRERLAPFIDAGDVDRIVLVTVARFMAKIFNPVSFYYCLRADGSPSCMVAEVNNTFGERHLYRLEGGNGFPLSCRHGKQFHVSPFNDLAGHYEFLFSEPGEQLDIRIRLVRDGETIMDASMRGTGFPLNTATLWKTVLRYPFTAGLTMPRILWQAALLHYKKKLPIFHKPPPDSSMTIKVNT